MCDLACVRMLSRVLACCVTAAIKYDPHQFVDVPTQNYTIVIGVPREFGPSRASGGVQVFHYDYIGQRDCPNVTQCIRDRRWYEGPFLSTPDGLVNQHTGYDVVLDRGVIVAGAPGDWTDNLENSGSAYVHLHHMTCTNAVDAHCNSVAPCFVQLHLEESHSK